MTNSLIISNNGAIIDDVPTGSGGADFTVQPGTVVDGVFIPSGDAVTQLSGTGTGYAIDPGHSYLITCNGA